MHGTVVVQHAVKTAVLIVSHSHVMDGAVWATQDTNAEAIIAEDATETGSRPKDTEYNAAMKCLANILAPQYYAQKSTQHPAHVVWK